MSESSYEGWTILELMGHRRLGGYVTEQEIAGKKMLRIEIQGEGDKVVTQFYSPESLYAMTPTTEEIARALGRRAPAPVHAYELPPRLPPADLDTHRDPDPDPDFEEVE